MLKREFQGWPKMTRISPFNVTISEKLDGTNACIVIEQGEIVGIQSRKRFITVEDDNYGFAGWVGRNEDALLALGDGHHFGEWVGLGIQKNPHHFPEKRFYLFNTHRWSDELGERPECCYVVPVLFQGVMTGETITPILEDMERLGKASGTTPEGVCVYYPAFDRYTKHTIKSPNGKWCKD